MGRLCGPTRGWDGRFIDARTVWSRHHPQQNALGPTVVLGKLPECHEEFSTNVHVCTKSIVVRIHHTDSEVSDGNACITSSNSGGTTDTRHQRFWGCGPDGYGCCWSFCCKHYGNARHKARQTKEGNNSRHECCCSFVRNNTSNGSTSEYCADQDIIVQTTTRKGNNKTDIDKGDRTKERKWKKITGCI